MPTVKTKQQKYWDIKPAGKGVILSPIKKQKNANTARKVVVE